jgi:hypothetical protein
MGTNFAASPLGQQCTAGKAGDEERSSAKPLTAKGKEPNLICSFLGMVLKSRSNRLKVGSM